MGAAAFVLIIACANVANLTLMRGVRREHELVVRAALGAGAARLRRLLLAENLVLAVARQRARAGDRLRRRAHAHHVRGALQPARRRDPHRRRGARVHPPRRPSSWRCSSRSRRGSRASERSAPRWRRAAGARPAASVGSGCSRRSSSRRSPCRSILLTGAGLLTRTMQRLSRRRLRRRTPRTC